MSKVMDMEGQDMQAFFRGDKLYGDDFSVPAIEEWFDRERMGYSGLVSDNDRAYRYEYHALNWQHGFRWLGRRTFRRALGFGSFRGDELEPIAARIEHITIVDPSGAAEGVQLAGKRVDTIAPGIDGRLAFADGMFDLITCFGVLHHIPNVTSVIGELLRVLAPGGVLLLREPIVSMGDWRKPRPGLTLNERGIPLPYLVRAVTAGGGHIERQSLCSFGPLERAVKWIRNDIYNSMFVAGLDAVISNIIPWKRTYHPVRAAQKLQPSAVFLTITVSTDQSR